MDVGQYEIHRIDAGSYRLDGGAMFGVVPKTLWEKSNPADSKNRIELALNNLLLIGNGRVILVDSGVGTKFNEKFQEIYAVDHSRGSLIRSLAAKNIQPEDITDVIITHLHFDHAGGTTIIDDDGSIKLQFPGATHYIQQQQLDWSLKNFPKDRASYLEENIKPLTESDRLQILNGTQIPIPGLELIISDGHTIGQQMVLVSDEHTRLFYAADLIPMRAHIPVPWIMAYDLQPMVTVREKQQILKRAVEENWIVFFEHDPRDYAGTIEKGDKGYQLQKSIAL